MPEGPSIFILKEEVHSFEGKKIMEADGSAQLDFERLENKKIESFKSWGKHFLICFDDFTIRIHFLLFGSYLINAQKASVPKLRLVFQKGEINFYACAIKVLGGDINSHYDWTGDIMNDDWDAKKAIKKLKEHPNKMICDALLDQAIFSGLGNIIKNEVLYRARIHPESLVGKIPSKKIKEIVDESRIYSFEFLKWKKKNELKKHWLAHTKKICKRCDLPMFKEYTGTKKRSSFFCTNCQKLHQ
jgi:endonuclease-8